MDVNSVAVRVTVRTSGAGNASALRTSRASAGLDGRGSGPVRGSRGGCEGMGRLPPSSLYRCARVHNFRKDDQSQAESHCPVERRGRIDPPPWAPPPAGGGAVCPPPLPPPPAP